MVGKKIRCHKWLFKAIEINPNEAEAYFNRGNYKLSIFLANALKDLGRKEDAIIDYSKVIEINPLNAKAYFYKGSICSNILLGNALMHLGRKEDAIINYSKAIDIDTQALRFIITEVDLISSIY